MKQYTVQPMTYDYIDEVYEIEKLCFTVPWSKEAFILEIDKNCCARYFMAKVGDVAAAYGGMWVILDEAHITNIAVHPDYRRLGIGRDILLALMADASKSGIRNMTLEVRVSNDPAINLYKKLGFVEEGIRKGYYADNNEDAIIMWNHDIQRTLKEEVDHEY